MSILIDRNTRLLVQGITGREGQFHTQQMLQYGTKVVAGTAPGRGGQQVEGVPVFNTVRQAVEATKPNASIIYVPAAGAMDAVLEAAMAEIPLVVCITEGVPTLDVIRAERYARGRGTRLIGPNCPGLISPGQSKVGILPGHIHQPGPIGIVSRSGTLTYEIVQALTGRGLGQSTCVGIGGDPVIGTSFVEVLDLFAEDPETSAVALVGEIGGSDEELAAERIARGYPKPVVAFIAGRTAPAGKRMGHAGAIIDGGRGTAEGKIRALQEAGVAVVDNPSEIPSALAARL